MKQIIPYLTLDNAIEAIDFYKTVFGAQLVGEIIYLNDETYKGKIGHATLKIKDSIVFISDVTDKPVLKGDVIHFVLELSDAEEVTSAFRKLLNGGIMLHELQEMMWCKLSGFVTDKYGVSWSLFCGHK